MSVRIDALAPVAADNLDDDAIAEHYSAGTSGRLLRMNFVSSVDGAATHEGLSGALGGPADRRVFDILRRLCDVVMVGAGTVRTERYGALRVDDTASAWRIEHGLAAQPTFAIVSGALNLDPGSPIFTAAPTRPIVVTIETASTERLSALAEVADTLVAGQRELDAASVVEQLAARGLGRVLCEGGPSLFATFASAEVVDELCLTVSPRLEFGDALRIGHSSVPDVHELALGGVLVSEGTLLLRYLTKQ